MTTTAWPLCTLALSLLLPACFSGGDDQEPNVRDDTESEVDADTDTDADTNADTHSDADTDTYTAATIPEIQQGLVEQGALVRIEPAVVVGPQLPSGFHLASVGGEETHAGLWISGELDPDSVAEGDLVSVTGEVTEREVGGETLEGDGTITSLKLDRAPTWLEDGAPPEAAVISLDSFDKDPEPWEGMLVQLDELVVSQGGQASWWVDGAMEICDLYHPSTALTGASLSAVRGLVWYEDGRFVVCPRGDDDLIEYDPGLEDCGESSCVSALAEGALVVSELMLDPEAVFDDLGEWLEIYNPGEQQVDLRGLEVGDDDGDYFVITEHLQLDPGAWAVLVANADGHTNGGVTGHWEYPYASFALADGEDEVVLAYGDMIFDRVAWSDGVTFSELSGAAAALDPNHLDADSNDDGDYWCAASTPYGDGDLGTPGSANDACVE